MDHATLRPVLISGEVDMHSRAKHRTRVVSSKGRSRLGAAGVVGTARRLGRQGSIHLGLGLLVLAGGVLPAGAQSLLCTPITAVPATITAPGVYCLDRDLVTNVFDSAPM